jgi:hypothetical protein
MPVDVDGMNKKFKVWHINDFLGPPWRFKSGGRSETAGLCVIRKAVNPTRWEELLKSHGYETRLRYIFQFVYSMHTKNQTGQE